jgi:hypothetical protein
MPSRDSAANWIRLAGYESAQILNPKMLHRYYKNAAANPLVANAGLIHKRRPFGPTFQTFFVGDLKASCQLQIIGRQRRRTTGTSRVVARLARRERTD